MTTLFKDNESTKFTSMNTVEHVMDVSDPWWTLIYAGLKPVEGRKNSHKWGSIKVGDIIKMVNGDKFYYTKVTKINEYPSVKNSHKYPTGTVLWEDPLLAYLQFEGLNNALPGLVSLEEGRRVYLQWSTNEEITEHGFRGIHVEVIQG